jgi:hypothetical protein
MYQLEVIEFVLNDHYPQTPDNALLRLLQLICSCLDYDLKVLPTMHCIITYFGEIIYHFIRTDEVVFLLMIEARLNLTQSFDL